VTAASAAMGAALYFALGHPWLESPLIPFDKIGETIVFVVFGCCVYAISALVFGAIRWSDLKNMARR